MALWLFYLACFIMKGYDLAFKESQNSWRTQELFSLVFVSPDEQTFCTTMDFKLISVSPQPKEMLWERKKWMFMTLRSRSVVPEELCLSPSIGRVSWLWRIMTDDRGLPALLLHPRGRAMIYSSLILQNWHWTFLAFACARRCTVLQVHGVPENCMWKEKRNPNPLCFEAPKVRFTE